MTSSTTDRRLGITGAIAIKAPCRCATTGNIVLSGLQTIDGITVSAGDRILVKDQTTTTDNGIYVADTGTWTRDLDADGKNDLRNGTLVRVNSGASNAAGWFSLSVTEPVDIGTSALTWLRESINNVNLSTTTASAGQTVFTVSDYQTNANAIAVFVNGIRRHVGVDFTETDSTHVTFITGSFIDGDIVDFYIGNSVGNLTAAAANLVSLSDSGDYYASTDVESAFQEIAQAVAVDNGDADVTLTNNSSNRIQRWNTALSTNRTATLSTSNAKEGATFYVIRDSGATGAYTLSVGTIATLRFPGQWCRTTYDAGTAAWVLTQYGTMPSAEYIALSADNGDASINVVVGTTERTQRWATPLTADRTATLSASGAYSGARFRLLRTEAASGNFSLSILFSVTLIRLYQGQWCDVEYTGTAWIVVASGNIRTPNTAILSLADDFTGEEIDSYLWQSRIGTDASCAQPTIRSNQLRGLLRMTTGASASASMAVNGVQLQSQLNWQANLGCLSCEFRIATDAITSVAIFAGFTNQVSALQIPINGAGGGDTFTLNANDAVGVLFDTTMTTAKWWMVGSAGGVGATAQNSAVAPIADTMETWRIDITAVGVATFYRNGSAIGTAMTGAVTANVPLTPVIAAFSRTTVSRNIDVDFLSVQAQR